MANVANNLLMLGLSNIRRKLFDLQAFHKQAHIFNFTGIIIYFCGTYYLYAGPNDPFRLFSYYRVVYLIKKGGEGEHINNMCHKSI